MRSKRLNWSSNRRDLMRMRLRLLLLLFIGIVAGCSPHYIGDGRFVDNGLTAVNERYVVELGTVDLTQQTTKTFAFKGLPAVSFVAGIQVPRSPDDSKSSPESDADIVLQIANQATGSKLVRSTGPLRDWVWSGIAEPSFVYDREKPGSYFVPRPDSTYTVTVAVRSPAPNATHEATVLLKSGGWK
jgi:hypothetical protein